MLSRWFMFVAVVLASACGSSACLKPDRFELDVNGPDGLLSFGFTLAVASGNTGLEISKTTIALNEGGAAGEYTLRLNRAPAADVTVTVTPDAQLTVSPTTVLFTSSDWNSPRAVAVTAVDNMVRNKGGTTGSITHSMTSSDTPFAAADAGSVSVNISDDDKLIFVTTAQHFPNLELSGAFSTAAGDALCNIDSGRPDTSAIYKAVIVGSYSGQTTRTACTTSNCTDPSENSDWVLTAFTTYIRPDGQAVGKTNAAGIIVLPLTNAWSDGGTASDKFWSGLLSDWRENTGNGTFPNCTASTGDWDTVTPSFDGQVGNVNVTGTTALEFTLHSCGSMAHLLCAEQ